MISRNVTIQNSVGLHARPATFFIQKANSFKSSIWVEKEERRAVVNFHNSRGFKVPESYGQKIAFEKAIEIVKGNCCKNGNCSDQFTDADKMEGGAE